MTISHHTYILLIIAYSEILQSNFCLPLLTSSWCCAMILLMTIISSKLLVEHVENLVFYVICDARTLIHMFLKWSPFSSLECGSNSANCMLVFPFRLTECALILLVIFNQINFKFETAFLHSQMDYVKWAREQCTHAHRWSGQTSMECFNSHIQLQSRNILSLRMKMKLKFRKSQLTLLPYFGERITLGRFNAMTVYMHSRFQLQKHSYLHRKMWGCLRKHVLHVHSMHVYVHWSMCILIFY